MAPVFAVGLLLDAALVGGVLYAYSQATWLGVVAFLAWLGLKSGPDPVMVLLEGVFGAERAHETYPAFLRLRPRPRPARSDALQRHLGARATAWTDLKPTGVVSIGEERHDARLTLGMARRGAEVRVVRVEGEVLLVEEVA